MFAEDLDPYFADFGQDASLDGAPVRVIFEAPTAVGGVGIGMADTRPTAWLPTASVPANPVGKSIVIASASYVVAERGDDGTGMTTLVLERP